MEKWVKKIDATAKLIWNNISIKYCYKSAKVHKRPDNPLLNFVSNIAFACKEIIIKSANFQILTYLSIHKYIVECQK